MKIYSLYVVTINKVRTLYNIILYGLISVLFRLFKIENIETFSDSNGWFFTVRVGENIFKIRSILTFLRPKFKYSKLVKCTRKLNELDKHEIYTPCITINSFYSKQKFVKGSVQLSSALQALDSADKRIALLCEVVDLVGNFHKLGLRHGDLKSKNILVSPSKKIFFVDLEFLSTEKEMTEIEELNTLFLSISKLIANDELSLLHQKLPENSLFRSIVFNAINLDLSVQDILRNIPFLEFEKESYSNEDIDIEVDDHNQVRQIYSLLRKSYAKVEIFYAFCDDIKIYIYSPFCLSVVDVHIRKPILLMELFLRKMISNKYKVFFITGPDGVGKSTVINSLLEDDYLLMLNNAKVYHANRFVNNVIKIKSNRIWDFFSQRSSLSFLIKIVLLEILKLKGKSKVLIFDRSFYDSNYQHGNRSPLALKAMELILHRNKVILLCDDAERIIKRKAELSIIEIECYYKYFENFNKTNIQVTDETEVKSNLERIIHGWILND